MIRNEPVAAKALPLRAVGEVPAEAEYSGKRLTAPR